MKQGLPVWLLVGAAAVVLGGVGLAAFKLGAREAGTAAAPPPSAVSRPGPTGEAPPPGGEAESEGDAGAGEQLPEPDFAEFNCGGQYEMVVSRDGDMDGDGRPEWVAGYQCTSQDDLGAPAEPAYLQFIRYDTAKSAWVPWVDIPAAERETALDESSILALDDLDGRPGLELVLQTYGFGVSSRPVYVYAYHMSAGGAEPACEPLPLQFSSDDTVLTYDVPGSAGIELLVARALMGSEAHAAPHRYAVDIYGWTDAGLRRVSSQKTSRTYPSGAHALREMLGVQGE
jgi:hypothetical protein